MSTVHYPNLHHEDEAPDFNLLRVALKEINALWMLGDHEIIGAAQAALLRVIHESAARLK